MKILALGGHADDIWLMAGGTLLKQMESGGEVMEVVFAETNAEKERAEVANTVGIASVCLGLENMKVDTQMALATTKLDEVVAWYRPDVVLCHDVSDHHQDHRAVYYAANAALRNRNIALVTYPSWNPRIAFDYNMEVDISDFVDDKNAIISGFVSQLHRTYIKAIIHQDVAVEKFKIIYLQL